MVAAFGTDSSKMGALLESRASGDIWGQGGTFSWTWLGNGWDVWPSACLHDGVLPYAKTAQCQWSISGLQQLALLSH